MSNGRIWARNTDQLPSNARVAEATMVHNHEFETMSRQELEQLQIERLQTTLNRVYRNVAFYRKLFDDECIDIDSIKTIQDVRRLPFTTREDLRAAYPYDMFAVPLRDIVRIHATSGTTGKPIVTGYTKNDIRHWSNLAARQLAAAGITDQDVVQIAFGYGLFTGGLGFHYGAEAIGASVIPASSTGHVREQIMIMKDYKATALLTLPSHAISIAAALDDMGIHPEKLTLQCGLFGAEPWSENLRDLIENKLRLRAFDAYGVAEIIGPGVAGECERRAGLHINEDHFIAEIINPETLAPASPGEVGELALTTVTKEGFPLIRYRTGDLTFLIEEPCDCGRTFRRISRVSGRTDDLLFVQGTKLFPSQIEAALLESEGVHPPFRIVIERAGDADVIDIRLPVSSSLEFFDEPPKLEAMKNRIIRRLKERLDIETRVSLVEARSLAGQPGSQACLVEDRRTL